MKFLRNLLSVLFSLSLVLAASLSSGSTLHSKRIISLDGDKFETIRNSIDLLSHQAGDSDVLQDYIHFFAVLRECTDGESDLCLKEIDLFLAHYPHSYLSDDILVMKIEFLHKLLIGGRDMSGGHIGEEMSTRIESLSDAILNVERRFLRKHPRNERVLYLYAQTLKNVGRASEAERVFKSLYLNGGTYYQSLSNEISPEDLSLKEALTLTRNLHKYLRFEDSMQILIDLLGRKSPSDGKHIYRALGETYFRMKKYKKAVRYYVKGDNFYKAGIASFRAAAYDTFEENLQRILGEKTEETCTLLLLRGLKKRREGDFENALRVFRKTYRKEYPCRETTLWHIGWAEFLKGNFLSASYNFRDLYGIYGDPQYLYWYARALERRGEDVKSIYSKLGEDSFYSALPSFRSGVLKFRKTSESVSIDMKRAPEEIPSPCSGSESGKCSEVISLAIERARVLNGVGFSYYAVRELKSIQSANDDDKLKICQQLHLLGAYRDSLRCAQAIKGRDFSAKLMYPIVFRDIVMEVSDSYALDPLLIYSIMREESRFADDAYSSAGALGLMQLMPYTARRMARNTDQTGMINSNRDILVPQINISLGSYYLRQLLDEFQSIPAAVAAYNAGEAAVRRWLNAYEYRDIDEFIEDIPYRETKSYVKKVMRSYMKYTNMYRESQSGSRALTSSP
jgi:soluble lytic murein transglycosylase